MTSTSATGGAQPRTICIANQKGGVGKTTTAVNLATALAAGGASVLMIDMDPQGNGSTGLGVGRADRSDGTYALLLDGRPVAETMRETAIPGLWLIPADPDLVGAEIELVSVERREFRLRDALRSLGRTFDYLLIDCPPSLGLLTVNALVAAESVLVPLQCEFFALEGISHLMRTVEAVRRTLNPALAMQGIVLTMFDRRNNLSELVAEDARGYFGDLVYDTVIPRNVRISEAPSHGLPVLLYDVRSPGAQAYARLAAELIRRENASRTAEPVS